jgi:hypothetical protein
MRKVSRKWLVSVTLIIFATCVYPIFEAFSFLECARIGDTMEMVDANCGDPSWVETETKTQAGQFFIPPQPCDGWLRQSPFMGNIALDVEDWVYNYGPSRFLRVLRFRMGVLNSIYNRGYGF